jgi:hypothetical protein
MSTSTAAHKLSVRVRMYTQGLGDCFLLTFYRGSERFNMLIDCGVLQGTEDAKGKMAAVVQNIKAETGGNDETNGRLDLVVATHEHWDHISGFAQAQPDFDQIDFDTICLGWTEDSNNRQAAELKKVQEMRREAIKKSKEAKKKSEGLVKLFERIDNILHFEDPDEADEDPTSASGGEPLAAATRRSGKQKAWDYLLNEKPAVRKFCRPGQLLNFRDFEGVRVYVLGPPEDEQLLRRSDPRKGGDEVFEKSFHLTLEGLFFGAVSGVGDAIRPFEEHIGMPEDQVEAAKFAPGNEFFRTYYGFADDEGEKWRRIDDDWLSLAGELALNLDSDTNNTCLALAIELVESGKVLLFPGDAQVGNWLSWEKLSWKVAGSTEPVTAKDLLERTVLYKVGHHGSHNATLKAKGLELMKSPDLCALLPVDEQMAHRQEWHHMPLKSLLQRLNEKARGRVLRADMAQRGGLAQFENEALAFMSAAEWARFRKTFKVEDLYIDLMIEE